MDALVTRFVGLESIKRAAVGLCYSGMARQVRGCTKLDTLHARFEGNPGTGKTSVARLYGSILKDFKRLPGDKDGKDVFVEITGAQLSRVRRAPKSKPPKPLKPKPPPR